MHVRPQEMLVIEVETDLGVLKTCLTFLRLCKPVDRKSIGALVSSLQPDTIHHVVLLEERIVYPRQLLYPLYLALRGEKTGQRIAKKLELDVLCYIACTDRIREAVDTLLPQGNTTRLLVVSFCLDCDVDELRKRHADLVEKLCQDRDCDLAIGISCTRLRYEPPPQCGSPESDLDYIESIVKKLLERVE